MSVTKGEAWAKSHLQDMGYHPNPHTMGLCFACLKFERPKRTSAMGFCCSPDLPYPVEVMENGGCDQWQPSSAATHEKAPQLGCITVLDSLSKIFEARAHEPVSQQIWADLNSRATVGLEKYGTRLKTHNGRNALNDAYQEVLDLIMYLRQHVLEIGEDKVGLTRVIELARDIRFMLNLQENV